MNEPFYSLKAVCKLTGLKPATLHAWEKRYGAVSPIRTGTNHRVYSANDVERLRLLVNAKDLGHSIGNIAQLSLTQLRHLVNSLSEQASEMISRNLEAKNKPARSIFCRRTLQALDEFNLDRVNQELAVARNRFDTTTFILELLVPLFAQINKLVEKHKLSVARQHAISSSVMANLYAESLRLRVIHARSPEQDIPPKRVVLATFDGDYHECGLLCTALLCMEHGMNVHYLGPSVPVRDLADTAIAVKADIIILSCPKVCPEQLRQPPWEYLTELASLIPRLCEIWIGGDEAGLLAQSKLDRKLVAFNTLHQLNRHLQRVIQP